MRVLISGASGSFGLEIENKDLELINNVPIKFNCDDILFLGAIEFDLSKKINEYIQELLEKI